MSYRLLSLLPTIRIRASEMIILAFLYPQCLLKLLYTKIYVSIKNYEVVRVISRLHPLYT